MIKVLDKTHDDLIALQAEGEIKKDDYDKVLPLLEGKVQKYQKIKGYAEVKELDGITLNALWEEIKADVKYFNNFEKIAVVGDATWKKMATKAADILPNLNIQYFDFSEKGKAEEWIER